MRAEQTEHARSPTEGGGLVSGLCADPCGQYQNMNINALLSPNESGPRDDSSSSRSPPAIARRPSGQGIKSNLSNEVSRSSGSSPSTSSSRPPTAHGSPSKSQQAFPLPSMRTGVPNFRPLHQPPTSHPSSAAESTSHNVQVQDYARPNQAQRNPSVAHADRISGM